MKQFISILSLLLTITLYSFGQGSVDKMSFEKFKQFRLFVLSENIVGKPYTYDFAKDSICNKTTVKYLGQVKTGNNQEYKILSSFYVHGISCLGTSSILVYGLNNKFIGHYAVGMSYDLPDTIINNNLIYLIDNPDCKFKNSTKISFESGLPNTIFIPCVNENTGNIYSFSGKE